MPGVAKGISRSRYFLLLLLLLPSLSQKGQLFGFSKANSSSLALPEHCRCIPKHSRCIEGASHVHCRCIVGALQVHCSCIAVALQLHCSCIAVALQLHWSCIVVASQIAFPGSVGVNSMFSLVSSGREIL